MQGQLSRLGRVGLHQGSVTTTFQGKSCFLDRVLDEQEFLAARLAGHADRVASHRLSPALLGGSNGLYGAMDC
ncbi:hypothetical protein [Limnothrix redekei]|uniref:Uncharacterized protein n=1 Tax=Limnothrix redekei LRLZ20PSL1 TaxID=3112953 RepID=A0ABW7CA65_9CYAN